MAACRACKGRDGHFGWCAKVGGPGTKPGAAPVFQAPGEAPVAPPVVTAPPTPPPPRDTLADHLDELAIAAALRESRAQVSVVAPAPPALPPGETRRSMALPRRPAPAVPVCRGCGKSALELPADWSAVPAGDGRPVYRCADCRAEAPAAEPGPAPEPARRAKPGLRVPEPVQTITPGVFVEPSSGPRSSAPFVWSDWTGEPEWEHLEVEATAHQLLVACRDGLPAFVPFGYAPEVLALAGLHLEELETALRKPHRVEIRPESLHADKGYPILAFARGDVQVILGMRIPLRPRVIAAYWTALLAPDTHRSAEHTGGGGARRASGLPATPTALVKRLTAEGCAVPEDWELAPGPVEVTFRGQSLGKLALGARRKAEVRADWQRFRRKVEAIKLREAKTG